MSGPTAGEPSSAAGEPRPGLAARCGLRLIAGYRRWLSPLLPPSCRYEPTCSAYCAGCLERFGLLRGGWLGLRRILRCHPWHPGGWDPVPETWPAAAAEADRSVEA